MQGKKWKNSYEYKRILEILDDYWLSEPDEKKVIITMEFYKSTGEYQGKRIIWHNPESEVRR